MSGTFPPPTRHSFHIHALHSEASPHSPFRVEVLAKDGGRHHILHYYCDSLDHAEKIRAGFYAFMYIDYEVKIEQHQNGQFIPLQ